LPFQGRRKQGKAICKIVFIAHALPFKGKKRDKTKGLFTINSKTMATEKQFKVTLNEDQMRQLSSYLSEATGDELPALVDFSAELQNIIDRQIEAYGEAIGDCYKKSSLLTLNQ
jgi:hypothetical protein